MVLILCAIAISSSRHVSNYYRIVECHYPNPLTHKLTVPFSLLRSTTPLGPSNLRQKCRVRKITILHISTPRSRVISDNPLDLKLFITLLSIFSLSIPFLIRPSHLHPLLSQPIPISSAPLTTYFALSSSLPLSCPPYFFSFVVFDFSSSFK